MLYMELLELGSLLENFEIKNLSKNPYKGDLIFKKCVN